MRAYGEYNGQRAGDDTAIFTASTAGQQSKANAEERSAMNADEGHKDAEIHRVEKKLAGKKWQAAMRMSWCVSAP
eukprot:3087621-Pleurochrysis_carterae.AAC.1